MTAPGLPDEVALAWAIERFDDFLSLEQGASPRTREAYGRDIRRLAMFGRVKGAGAPGTLTPQMLRLYVWHLKDLGLSPLSIRRNVSAARTYFKFLLGEGVLTADPSDRPARITRVAGTPRCRIRYV